MYMSSPLALVGNRLVVLIFPLVGSAIVLCLHPHVHVCDDVFTYICENLIEGMRSELDWTPKAFTSSLRLKGAYLHCSHQYSLKDRLQH